MIKFRTQYLLDRASKCFKIAYSFCMASASSFVLGILKYFLFTQIDHFWCGVCAILFKRHVSQYCNLEIFLLLRCYLRELRLILVNLKSAFSQGAQSPFHLPKKYTDCIIWIFWCKTTWRTTSTNCVFPLVGESR